MPATNQVRRTQFRDINDTYETQSGDTGYVKYCGRLFGLKNDVLAGLDLNRNYYKRNDNVRGGTSLVNATDFDPGNYLDFYDEQSKPFYRIRREPDRRDLPKTSLASPKRLRSSSASGVITIM